MPESSSRGALTEAVYYILLSLHSPLHGYGIMQLVEELSKGRVKMGSGTLYGALNTLIKKEWIKLLPSDANNRKKEYIITALGKEVAIQEVERLEELLTIGTRITGGE